MVRHRTEAGHRGPAPKAAASPLVASRFPAEFYPEPEPLRRGEPATFERALALRRTLRAELIQAVESGEFANALIDKVNDVLAGGRPQLRRRDDGAFIDIVAAREDDRIPLAIAMAAAQLVAEGDIDRVRACKNERCSVVFHDRTKSNTRRFCSTLCFDQVALEKNAAQVNDRSKKLCLDAVSGAYGTCDS